MRMTVEGPDFDTGEIKETTLQLTIGEEEGGQARVDALGLMLLPEDGIVKLDEPLFGTPVADDLDEFDFYADDPVRLMTVLAPQSQPPKELVFIPALLFLGLIAFLQRGRAARQTEVTA
jgi:hypothetical protein